MTNEEFNRFAEAMREPKPESSTELPDITGRFVKDYEAVQHAVSDTRFGHFGSEITFRHKNLGDITVASSLRQIVKADFDELVKRFQAAASYERERRLAYWRSLPWWKRMWRKRP